MWKWRIARNAIFYSSSAISTSPITRLVCPQYFSITVALSFPCVLQSSQEKLKTAYAKQGLLWKVWKWRVLPFSFFTFLLFTKRANLTRVYKIFKTLALIKTWWKKRHVDNGGSYENDIFCEIGEFGKDSSKVWQKIYGLLAAGKLEKMARTHQRFCKTSNEVTKREMAIIRKWQILGEKGKFRQKWRVCEKVIKASAKYSNKMTKRCILTNGDFTKITNLTRIYRFGKN